MKKMIVMLSLCITFTLSIVPTQITSSTETKQVLAMENNLEMKREVTRGVVIHNDAGSLSGSQYSYLESYSTDQLAKGFTHYYVAKGDVYQFWDDSKVAWHTGNFAGNTEYIGIEVTNSYGPEYKFRENEEETFKLTAKLLAKYNLEPNRDTVRLHREFRATSCPHRSWALHGGSVDAVKDYFIEQIKKYMPVNIGYIDKLEVVNNELKISGWHANTKATEKHLRYLFIMDALTNQELKRIPLVNKERLDVAAVLPNFPSAKTSGFSINVPITSEIAKKNIYVVTRFLVKDDPNESLADLWFVNNKVLLPSIKNSESTTNSPLIKYQTHVQNIGWQPYVDNGKTAGTSGRSLRTEGLRIQLANLPVSGGIDYTTHVQNIGWQDQVSNNQLSGTTGKALRLEAIKINLTGEISKQYDVYYRVHIANYGWLSWAKNGENAGSEGKSLRMEAIEVKLIKKGDTPLSAGTTFIK